MINDFNELGLERVIRRNFNEKNGFQNGTRISCFKSSPKTFSVNNQLVLVTRKIKKK